MGVVKNKYASNQTSPVAAKSQGVCITPPDTACDITQAQADASVVQHRL